MQHPAFHFPAVGENTVVLISDAATLERFSDIRAIFAELHFGVRLLYRHALVSLSTIYFPNDW